MTDTKKSAGPKKKAAATARTPAPPVEDSKPKSVEPSPAPKTPAARAPEGSCFAEAGGTLNPGTPYAEVAK